MTEEDVSDFVVTCYAQNAHIIRAMKRIQIDPISNAETTVEGLCRALQKICNEQKKWLPSIEAEVRQLVGLKIVPTTPDGEWIGSALILAELLRTPCEKLWPKPLDTVIPYKRSHVTETSIGQDASWKIM